MKQLFYSEILNKTFETEKECLEAEKAHEDKMALVKAEKEQRAADAKKVEDAYKEANEAYKKAKAELEAFVEKHGSYHKTFSNQTPNSKTLFDIFFDIF